MEDNTNFERTRPLTAQEQENKMINLAMARAEELLKSKKTPLALITHFLRLATEQTMLKREKLRRETTLLEAKTTSIEISNNMDEVMQGAIAAMTEYAIPEQEYYDEEIQ